MRLNPFKTFTLKWWQGSLLKLASVSLGIILGIMFTNLLSNYLAIFGVIFGAGGVYLTYVWLKQ